MHGPAESNEQFIPAGERTFYRAVTINEMHDIDAVMAEITAMRSRIEHLAAYLDKAAAAGMAEAAKLAGTLRAAPLIPAVAVKPE